MRSIATSCMWLNLLLSSRNLRRINPGEIGSSFHICCSVLRNEYIFGVALNCQGEWERKGKQNPTRQSSNMLEFQYLQHGGISTIKSHHLYNCFNHIGVISLGMRMIRVLSCLFILAFLSSSIATLHAAGGGDHTNVPDCMIGTE